MANWLSYKTFILLLFPLIFAFETNTIANKWGFYGHQQINRIAVFTLPSEMIGFYKEHIEFITDHSVDPDKRRYTIKEEAARHYIDLDHYGLFPFDSIPKSWSKAVEKYSADTLNAYGIVPWHIQLMKSKLQKAFEEKNIDLILKYSSEIGHYIADAHVPLHTTQNYNGQLTNQRGIHGLWESRLVELNASNYDFFVGRSQYIERPLDFIWNRVKESHFALDSVFRFEKEVSSLFTTDQKYSFETKGNQTVQVYSIPFSQAYHVKLNGMIERRMRTAILSIGSIWYTAWVDAGQPDLSSILHTPPSDALKAEIKNLNESVKKHIHSERICD